VTNYYSRIWRLTNKGKVYLEFIVEKDGSLNDIKSLREIGYGTGEEAIVLNFAQNGLQVK
jgi:hypothetical protein